MDRLYGTNIYNLVRYNPFLKENEYLMVCRQNSFGFIDFMRGKYSIYNKQYICNMVKQMTIQEKKDLIDLNFDQLWKKLWSIPDENNINGEKDTKTIKNQKSIRIIDNILIN